MLAINQKKQVLAQATLQSGTSIKNRRLASNSYTVVAKRTTTISRRRSRVISNAYSQVEGKIVAHCRGRRVRARRSNLDGTLINRRIAACHSITPAVVAIKIILNLGTYASLIVRPRSNKTSAFYPLSWVSVAITLNDGITTPTSSIADNTITVDVAGMRITS